MNQRLFTRLYLGMCTIIAGMLITLFYYFTHKIIESENQAKKITAHITSQTVLDKIDQSLYTCQMDNKAFAYNSLVTEAVVHPQANSRLEEFMNQMVQYQSIYDLLLLCNMDGNVIAVNTKNSQSTPLSSSGLIGSNMYNTDWFRGALKCINTTDSWHSNLTVDQTVAQLYKSSGQGIAFAVPVRNSEGDMIGVWYTFTNWQKTAEKIRKDAETELQKKDPQAQILLYGAHNEKLTAIDRDLFFKKQPELLYQADENALIHQASFDKRNMIAQQATSKGILSDAKNHWKAVTLLSPTKFTLSMCLSGEILQVVLIVLFANSVMIAITYLLIHKNLLQVQYIDTLRDVLEKVARGIIVSIPENLKSKNEIGQISSSVSEMVDSLKTKTLFSDEIAKGNLSVTLTDLFPEDRLGHSLIHMRNQLQKVQEDHTIQLWKTEGLTTISSILRNNQNIKELSENILSFIIRYLKANQGSLFLVKQKDSQAVLELMACHAFNRNKHSEEPVFLLPGQGLTGQAFLEGNIIYLTEIPENYVRITSGLGEATPRILLIVPLKTQNEIKGILEIASFSPILPYEIEFVKAIAENIAATLRDYQITEQMQYLLEESRVKAEQMNAQEISTREMLEQLVVIQEELKRKEMELNNVFMGIDTTFAIIEFDIHGNILTANDNFLHLMDYKCNDVKGKHHRLFVDTAYADSEEYSSFWTKLKAGEPNTARFKRYTRTHSAVWLQASYIPLKDASGIPYKIIKLATDVTKESLMELEMQEHTEMIACYEEEMKSTYDELQQRTQQVELYEAKIQSVFEELQKYTRKVSELENKNY
ncbi:GAF domain-containing protein [Xanthocytophaga agilis]|uniref:PAS domain-containing protein n=1 Tax=Xanthocytophaga agilis TaxID=3048010 RepID=A0AAE3UG86_9BACT|nr:GAF domain-containing protein [Xanthocytophaga agilis]MDJ1501363.1 PAS domain-containing protein [Xanthocytophaga agilis]